MKTPCGKNKQSKFDGIKLVDKKTIGYYLAIVSIGIIFGLRIIDFVLYLDD